MSDMAQMEDNIRAMKDFEPLSDAEKVCPQHLPIRELLGDVARTFE